MQLSKKTIPNKNKFMYRLFIEIFIVPLRAGLKKTGTMPQHGYILPLKKTSYEHL